MNEENLIQLPDGVQVESTEPATDENGLDRVLEVNLTFKQEGIKIDVRSNLTALEQLGAIEIFKAHLLASALGDKK
jgi:hypothetical protein